MSEYRGLATFSKDRVPTADESLRTVMLVVVGLALLPAWLFAIATETVYR